MERNGWGRGSLLFFPFLFFPLPLFIRFVRWAFFSREWDCVRVVWEREYVVSSCRVLRK